MELPIKPEGKPKEIPKKPVGEKVGEMVVREKRWPISKKPLYLKLEKFKEILEDVSIIRGNIKKFDELLHNLIKARENKDLNLEKWHSIMEDIQKKLIFIEKTLFKGD